MGHFADAVWLCEMENGEVFSLEGVAADMWKALAVYGDIDIAVDYLIGEYAVDEVTMYADLCAFTETLTTKGLLERC
jgi:hypothetical protein